MESWRRNPGRGILEEESWRWKPERRILAKESWKRIPWSESPENPGGRIREEGTRRGSEATSRHPWRDIQGPSGPTKDPLGATRTTIWAERKSVLKPLCFSEESGAGDLLACTGARQHARSTAPAHKSWWQKSARDAPDKSASPRITARAPTV